MMLVQPFMAAYMPNCYLLLKTLGPISSFVHNSNLVGNEHNETIYGFLSKINYDLMFMAQGILDEVVIEHHVKEL